MKYFKNGDTFHVLKEHGIEGKTDWIVTGPPRMTNTGPLYPASNGGWESGEFHPTAMKKVTRQMDDVRMSRKPTPRTRNTGFAR